MKYFWKWGRQRNSSALYFDSQLDSHFHFHRFHLMFQYFSYGFLFIFLAVLAYQDFLYRKIPNRLILYGFIISLVLKIPVCNGILEIIAYPLIPFFLLLPLWFLHGIGAADIKLFCIISLYLNPERLLMCIFISFILAIWLKLKTRSRSSVPSFFFSCFA